MYAKYLKLKAEVDATISEHNAALDRHAEKLDKVTEQSKQLENIMAYGDN